MTSEGWWVTWDNVDNRWVSRDLIMGYGDRVPDASFPHLVFSLRGNADNYVRCLSTRLKMPSNWELVGGA